MAGLLLGLIGCGGVGDPVSAGLDTDDEELADFLGALYESAWTVPESGALRGRLGIAYDANGFIDAAELSYRQAEALEPRDFRWPYHRAFLLAERGLIEDALSSVDRAIALDPTYLPARLQRAAWLLDLDLVGEAVEAYGELLDRHPRGEVRAVATAGLARSYLREGRQADAIALLEPVAVDIGHPYLYGLLAKAYRAAGRSEDAAAAVGRGGDAVRLRWRDEQRDAKDEFVRGFHGRLGLAERLLRHGESRAAATMLESLREAEPDDMTLLNNLAIAYRLTGRPHLAYEVLRHGIGVHPDYYLFHYNLANLHEERGQARLAVEHYGHAIELAPSLTSAYERKGLLLIREGDYDAAKAVFAAMTPYGERAIALYYTALVEGERSQWPAVVESLQRAVRLDPELTKGHIFLGRAYAEMGRFDEARLALARAEVLGTHARDLASALARLADLEETGS